MNESPNHFLEFEDLDDFSNLDTKNLLTEIWIKPTLVFKYLFKTNPEKYVWPLMITAGAVGGLEKGLEKAGEYNSFAFGYVIGTLLGGALLGWISIYIYAWLLSLFGSGFLNGKAEPKAFRTVIAWSNIPSICTVVLTFISAVLYGNKLNDINLELTQTEAIFMIVLGLLQLGLSIWSLVLNIIGTMHIQNFKAGKATLNVLLPFITLAFLFIIIYFIFN